MCKQIFGLCQITDVIPLHLCCVVMEDYQQVECDPLHEGVPCFILIMRGSMFYPLQVHPWTAVNLLSQDLGPGVFCFLQEKIGVE